MPEYLWGDWSIDQRVFGWLLSNLSEGKTVLELGSGWASGELSRYYKVYSIEDHLEYNGRYNTNYIFAPIKDGKWYDADILRAEMPKSYDLLLIDGPQHNKRWHLMENLDLFNWNIPVIIDDVQEGDLMHIGKKLSEEVCKRPYELIHGMRNKIAMVIA